MARLLGELGLAGSISVKIGFTTLFFRNYYVSIPVELVKAAKVDGAYEFFLNLFTSLIANHC